MGESDRQKEPQNHIKTMPQKFTIKEIAFQAGLSPATVDRALHSRASVRQVTKDRVEAAIAELDRQYAAARLDGRKFTIDVVIQSPKRFSSAVRQAFEAELPLVRPASFRMRFHLEESMEEREIIAKLYSIARRGSHGIVLKVPATVAIETCLREIGARGVPIVTYVTDVAADLRLAYVGMENRKAGATAAHLLNKMKSPKRSKILLTLSSQTFQGEEQRRVGFLEYFARRNPTQDIVSVSEGLGVNRTTKTLVLAALEAHPEIDSVYSIGGGNRAILDAFAEARRPIDIFAAHDLDRTNKQLLQDGKLSFVLHHNFRQDARRVSLLFLKHYRLVPDTIEIEEADIGIAVPL